MQHIHRVFGLTVMVYIYRFNILNLTENFILEINMQELILLTSIIFLHSNYATICQSFAIDV